MKLYYHQTDGGAEYYSLDHVDGCDEGASSGIVLRTDGNEFEVFTRRLQESNIKLVLNGGYMKPEVAERLDEIRKEALAIGFGEMSQEKKEVYAKSIAELVNEIYALSGKKELI